MLEWLFILNLKLDGSGIIKKIIINKTLFFLRRIVLCLIMLCVSVKGKYSFMFIILMTIILMIQIIDCIIMTIKSYKQIKK